ncbi:MAG: hypothetical protein SFU53_01400 [Terrimicrobiaceae bacterium]|nr:hypothetical protein [Terrimicrobiaceae bacterium]
MKMLPGFLHPKDRDRLPPMSSEQLLAGKAPAGIERVVSEAMFDRVQIEVSLLRLGDLLLNSESLQVERTEALLQEVNDSIKRLARHTGPRVPQEIWAKCRKLDRHFSRLKVCDRITGFIDRFVESLPQRPYGHLIDDERTREYFEVVRSIRAGKTRPENIDWRKFADIFAQLPRWPNQPKAKKRQEYVLPLSRMRRGTLSFPENQALYVAFLEADRTDLLWTMQHYRRVWSMWRWIGSLGNEEYLTRLRPFVAVMRPFSEAASFVEEAKTAIRQSQNADRKRRSREKIRKKV